MDYDITRAKELIERREQIDEELAAIFATGKSRKPQKCSSCGEEGHSARTCPTKKSE